MEELQESTIEPETHTKLQSSSITKYQQLGRITSGRSNMPYSNRNSGCVLKNTSAQLNAFNEFKTKAKSLKK